MGKQLNESLALWLAFLKHPSERTGEDLSHIPCAIRTELIERGLAHLHDGRLEITFEGIMELRRIAEATPAPPTRGNPCKTDRASRKRGP